VAILCRNRAPLITRRNTTPILYQIANHTIL
jgi:hypothetical protein